MAELTPQERLQPALLDRLTDDDPTSRQEPRERRVMSTRQLRLEAGTDLAGAPDVRRSVVNFGLPALSGKPATSMDVTELERAIRQSILDFEPRILPDTLRVTALLQANELDHHNVIGVEIHAQLWAQPVPLELLVRTEIDLETGHVEIADLVSSRAV